MSGTDPTRSLYRLKKGDIDKASEVLSRAFFLEPDMVKILPEEEMRRKKLKMVFYPFIKFGLIFGEVYAPSSDMEGVALRNHSSKKEINFWRSLRSGFLGMVSKLDKEERETFIRYGKEMDIQTKKTIQGEHWLLFILGVDPDRQRKGYGRRLLEPMLRRIDEEKLPVMLDTDKQVNVEYYRKFGFEVKRTYRVLENDHWGMVRERKSIDSSNNTPIKR